MNRSLMSALVLGSTLAVTGTSLAKPVEQTTPAHAAKKSKAKKPPHDGHHATPAPAPTPTPTPRK